MENRPTRPPSASGTFPEVELTQAATWHRQAAALAAAADRVGVADADLPAVRERLAVQQARLAGAATGSWPLALAPTAADVAAAMPALGDLSPAAVANALTAIAATLDAVDAALEGSPQPVAGSTPTPVAPSGAPAIGAVPWPSAEPPRTDWPPPTLAGWAPQPTPLGPPPPPPPAQAQAGPGPVPADGVARRGLAAWPVTGRNLAVYGAYAGAVTILQVIMFALYNEQNLSLLAPCCLFVLPPFSWAAGWLTIGAAFGSGPADRTIDRTPRLGAVVSLAPDLLLCAWLGFLLANA